MTSRKAQETFSILTHIKTTPLDALAADIDACMVCDGPAQVITFHLKNSQDVETRLSAYLQVERKGHTSGVIVEKKVPKGINTKAAYGFCRACYSEQRGT